ncbi:pilus assembly protein CpaE [Rhizobiales bacterium GAS188]|nr:pilus assembly protein CpaE [Rhizobiales bacterium GAS188]
MSDLFGTQRPAPASTEETELSHIVPLPRISLQAFCETPELAGTIEAAAADRRMSKVHVKLQMGGAPAAVEAYSEASTPNVIAIESIGNRDSLLDSLDRLAGVCDPGTKVVVVGHVNDVLLYRELMRRGVSEYLIAPVEHLAFIQSLSELFHGDKAEPLGRVIAVYGAKGGCGASTIAHNLGWTIARHLQLATVIVDLDLPFGTAGLDFNQDPPQGIVDAVSTPERLDATLLERLLSTLADNLNLLAAPATLDRLFDFEQNTFDAVLDLLRSSVPCIVLDLPHQWTAPIRHLLLGADHILLVAEPDLANLRNAKSMHELLKSARPNDSHPRLLLNKTGVPKRPEIAIADFAKAVGVDATIIPYDAQLFGSAANNGQMISEIQANGKHAEIFLSLARTLTGRAEIRKSKFNLPLKLPFLKKMASRKG